MHIEDNVKPRHREVIKYITHLNSAEFRIAQEL